MEDRDRKPLLAVPHACVAAVVVALCCGLVGATSAAAAVQPYGTHDGGGFRNVLPSGEAGTDNLTQFGDFISNSIFPPHWIDQLPLYRNLLYATPTLTNASIRTYFKDATFGVKPADVASTTSPEPGVTIVRDKRWGIPHIYGDTRGKLAFGAGFAGAQDRLFLMDVLRHTGRADLSSFLGGSNIGSDESQWQFAPYTEADLRRQIDLAPVIYGDVGSEAKRNLQHYVDGINAYIGAAIGDADLMPAEYALLGKSPQLWKPTDVIAVASLIGGIFGKGGGREVDSARTMQAFVTRFGRDAGRRAWLDFRSKNDPQAPTTVSRPFPYETTSPFAPRGLALPDHGSVKPAPVARVGAAASGGRTGSFGGIGAGLRDALDGAHASNWELVLGAHSRTGHPIGVLGPQVGYYDPAILMEEDLHAPGVDARGATFPGINLVVQLGRGRDYAWSATTSTSDNVDTFAEVLCQDKFHYLYKGRCRAMRKLVRTNSWSPNLIDSTPAGSETMTAYRTIHGIVYARGTVHGQDVAFVRARTTYFREADSVIGFSMLNDPGFVTGPRRFERAASKINFLFNWSYIDRNNIAYYMSGALPARARGTSPDFPVLGTGQYDWRGFNPSLHSEKVIGFSRHPHAINPDFLVSWNNKQAPLWSAADDQYAYGPLHRSQMIADKVRRGTSGRRMNLAQLVQAMEEPATQDLRGYAALPQILRAIGQPDDPALQQALGRLRAWHRAGAHRRDLNQDGSYEHNQAVELMDAWWPLLVKAEFAPSLGKAAFDRLQRMIALGDHTGRSPNPPDFFDGWWGYVVKDLRDLFGSPPTAPYSRVYCGQGSAQRCRHALRRSLRDALQVTPQQLYGFGGCVADPEPSCFDQNRFRTTSAISLAPFPFQNRPVFQQTVSVGHGVP